MKKWEKPELAKLSINMTAYGDDTSTTPDYTLTSMDGSVVFEQTFGPSGSTNPAHAETH